MGAVGVGVAEEVGEGYGWEGVVVGVGGLVEFDHYDDDDDDDGIEYICCGVLLSIVQREGGRWISFEVVRGVVLMMTGALRQLEGFGLRLGLVLIGWNLG